MPRFNIKEMLLEDAVEVGNSDCHGLVFRFSSSVYFSKHNSVEVRKSLRLLKRDSCPGCSLCAGDIDYLKEDIENCGSEKYLDGLIDGEKYQLVIKGSYDYEYGWDAESEFVKVIK